MLKNERANVLLYGHTHKPFFRKIEKIWLINDGSVGIPKDGDSRASWILLDIDKDSIKIDIKRCKYNLSEIEKAFYKSGLPHKFLIDIKI